MDSHDEASPLLGHQGRNPVVPAVPSILPLPAPPIELAQLEDICPHRTLSQAHTAAFTLLRCLEGSRLEASGSNLQPDEWKKVKEAANNSKLWMQFAEKAFTVFLGDYCSSVDIDQVLWTPFPLRKGQLPTIRVVDYLARDDIPEYLIAHPAVILSLAHTWKHGHPTNDPALWTRLETICSPRVLHLIDVAIHIAYLWTLLSYVLNPPAKPFIFQGLWYNGLRPFFLTFYSSLSLLSRWTSSAGAFLLVFLAFSVSLPSVPFPGEPAFTILLLALFFHLVDLHFPKIPSPLFVLPTSALSLSTRLKDGIQKIFLPAVAFFLPIILTTLFLLSVSMADSFVTIQTFVTESGPSPIETRLALLTLLSAELLLFCAFVFISPLPIGGGWTTATQDAPKMHDKLTTLALTAAVVDYGSPHTFPLSLRIIPAFASVVEFVTGGRARRDFVVAWIWRILVMPVGLVVAGIWGWGLAL